MTANAIALSRCLALLVAASLAGPALASGGSSGDSGGNKTVDADYVKAQKAIAAKDWPKAVQLLQSAESRDPASADIANLLGFAERNQGNLDAAFAHYEKALQLDPKHRGAHEYVGEAYLMVDNVTKAEEHLATLGKLCRSSCEESKDLRKSIEAYKQSHAS
jgi:tetratricopeptide (TPR) repeat protein